MAAVRGQLVTLGRSGIHGYGMYARCDLHANEIVMEYTGQVVRQTVRFFFCDGTVFCYDIYEKLMSVKN